MCGIAGYVSAAGISEETLRRMADALAHRGPDAGGVLAHGAIGLAHRRLSILDLSSAAHQPMLSACGRYAIAYNGEVYNFRELADQLGIRPRTTSDTEVILEAFAKVGPAVAGMMNGMFAIAILDKEAGKLHLMRDRLGIKPLYVYQSEGVIGFASELKAFMAVPSVFKLSLNRDAIPLYLRLGYVPQPFSIYQEVSKFPSGSVGVCTDNGLIVNSYWQPQHAIRPQAERWDEEEAADRLEALLLESVRMRMVSDVPFGTFLSGGVDSSLITALAQKSSPTPVRTFSIGFGSQRHNEAHHARKVAEHLGTDHHEHFVTEQDALDLVSAIVPQFDEPFADSSAIPTMLVSQMARQHVTMTLSGDGGDELYLGYGAYLWAERLGSQMLRTLRSPIAMALSMGSDRFRRIARMFRFSERDHLPSHVFSQEQYLFSNEELQGLLTFPCAPDHPMAAAIPDSFARSLSAAERQAFFDLQLYLKDDLLVKVDRATMRYGLETRVPMLDHRAVELALNLPQHLKLHNGTAKYLLKKVLMRHLPAEVVMRPKWGFSVPLADWMNGPLKPLVDGYLSQQAVQDAGIVHFNEVKVIRAKYAAGHTHLYNRIWALMLLHWWVAHTKQ